MPGILLKILYKCLFLIPTKKKLRFGLCGKGWDCKEKNSQFLVPGVNDLVKIMKTKIIYNIIICVPSP